MDSTAKLKAILKSYAAKKNSAIFSFQGFCDYMHRYSQKFLEEQEDLLPYVSNAYEAVTKELEVLSIEKFAIVINKGTDKQAIVVTSFFMDRFAKMFRQIKNNCSIPFPMLADLQKHVTPDILITRKADEYITERLANQENNNENLYLLSFTSEAPSILFPASVPVMDLIDCSVGKLRAMLSKDEYHDYFLKKLRISNPGKDISVKAFFSTVATKPIETTLLLEAAGENFYYWNQLCHFIRKDYEKVKDMTPEDIGILQSIHIIEIATNFYKNCTTKNQQRETALKNLEIIINRPPYFFTKDDICKFTDSKGIPLLGQYSQDDLNAWLRSRTVSTEQGNLPDLLVFKIESGTTYFIMKTKVFSLILRLCSEARDIIKEQIEKEWTNAFKNFENIPEMKEQKDFEKRLIRGVKDCSPILHALLNSNFLALLYYEIRSSSDPVSEQVYIFANGKMLPYSEILMLSRQEIATDVKILLPFWYTNTFIAWICSLFLKKGKSTTKKNKSKSKKAIETEIDDDEIKVPGTEKVSKKEKLKGIAQEIEEKLIPYGSTLEHELNSYILQWNKQINKQSRDHLTEDVNCYVRDYIRKILRTIKNNSFSAEQVADIAETIVKTPALEQIKETDALKKYVQLYILYIIKKA
ncbi:MAG: hypothetical protein ACTTHG_05335 [Treponemataceae bacterium]